MFDPSHRVGKMSGHCLRLLGICDRSEGLSGRCLRKIPFLAHALHLKSNAEHVIIEEYLDAVEEAVKQQKRDFEALKVKK